MLMIVFHALEQHEERRRSFHEFNLRNIEKFTSKFCISIYHLYNEKIEKVILTTNLVVKFI